MEDSRIEEIGSSLSPSTTTPLINGQQQGSWSQTLLNIICCRRRRRTARNASQDAQQQQDSFSQNLVRNRRRTRSQRRVSCCRKVLRFVIAGGGWIIMQCCNWRSVSDEDWSDEQKTLVTNHWNMVFLVWVLIFGAVPTVMTFVPNARKHASYFLFGVLVIGVVLIWWLKSTRAIRQYWLPLYICKTPVRSLEKSHFLKLQNGSDIRGVAVAGVEGEPVTLTEQVSEAIAAAFAAWLSCKKEGDGSRTMRVSIGHDSRISASELQEAVCRGLINAGVDVLQFGMASTPALSKSTLTKNEEVGCPVDGAIMITAGHLPFNKNGFKFFTKDGGLGNPDIKDILERAFDIYKKFTSEGPNKLLDGYSGSVRRVDYMSIYASDLVREVCKAAGNLEKPLEGFHIVVDAGNGAGGFFVEKVLEPLGAVTIGSQFLDPDGMFPNHIPNPEDRVAMVAIIQAVLNYNADLGIIFNTDVARSAAVDSIGCELNRNQLIALISAIVLEDHPGTTIVTDSVTSDGLSIFIENKLEGKHRRYKRGYKNVINEAIRLNSIGEDTHLAIETSGHGAFKDNDWLDDGAYLMVKLLNKMVSARALGIGGSKVLADLVKGLQKVAVIVEMRLKIDEHHADLKGGSFRFYGEAILKHLGKGVNDDGVKVYASGGWYLLRLSLHDPVMPLNIEAANKEAAVELARSVREAVRQFQALDISSLDRFIG